jgi:hypothetical protein
MLFIQIIITNLFPAVSVNMLQGLDKVSWLDYLQNKVIFFSAFPRMVCHPSSPIYTIPFPSVKMPELELNHLSPHLPRL